MPERYQRFRGSPTRFLLTRHRTIGYIPGMSTPDIAASHLLAARELPKHTTRAVRQRAKRKVERAVAASSVAIVASRLGVGRMTCHRWANQGNLPHAMYVAHIFKVLGRRAT